MARILAYTSPGLGHLLPISALLAELSRRGHTIHLRTLSAAVEIGQRLGFTTDAIDPRIERIELDDWKTTNPRASLKLSVAVFGRRAVHEATDLAETVASGRECAETGIQRRSWSSRARVAAAGAISAARSAR